jgi:hypothetical protein
MASKSSRSIFNNIFSRKERSRDRSIVELPAAHEVVIEEQESSIQPPRLRRLEESRSAEIQAYRDSLNPPLLQPSLESIAMIPEDVMSEKAPQDVVAPSKVDRHQSDRHQSDRHQSDRRKARRQAKKRARRSQTLGKRFGKGVKDVRQSTLRGVGKGAKWTVNFTGRQSKALFDFVYPPVARYVSKRRWNFILTGIIALTIGTGSAAVWWLSKVPPVADCGKISDWSPDNQRLYCLQVAAAQTGTPEDILKAMDLVKDWPSSHPLYGQGSQSMTQWTEQLMVLARDRFDQQDLDGAIALAQKVPESSPIYKETREEIDRWQEARNLGQKIYDKIQVALQKQYWEEASGLLSRLSTIVDPSWQKRLTEIRQQLDAEKAAGAVFKQAQIFAKSNPPENLGRAIALTDPINRKTFVWQTALKDVEQWRNKVFDLAIVQLLQKKNPTTANTLITSIPANIPLTDEQNQFVHLAQATDVLSGKDIGVPLLQQMGRLALANQLLAQIPQDSRFSKEVDALKPKLDERSDDTVQLETARAMANLGTIPFLQSAIAQAERIGPNRPSRLQSQTYIAQWRKEVERLEDAPLIAQAKQLAKQGSIAQYNAAATLMDQIVKGRALYTEAQRQKNNWIAQAQTLEDQPILRQASSQADAGQLSQAIQTARKIGSNRALYAEAQRSIGGWADQLQAIADRATMERAAALAAQGNLTQAIDTASSVNSSAVSSEARSSISQWSSEREKIRQTREPSYNREPEPTAPPSVRDPEPPVTREPEQPRRDDPAPVDPAPASLPPRSPEPLDPLPPTQPSP